MIVHTNPLFSVYFGNAEDDLDPDQYSDIPPGTPLLSIAPYNKLTKLMPINALTFPKQVHGDQGLIVTLPLEHPPFSQPADYLATKEKRLGIGVMTADCLPIVLYDSMHHAAAIVHAGWKGSVKEITAKAVTTMQEQFGTRLAQLRIFFGPSIKACCYKVSDDFVTKLEGFPFAQEVLHREQEGLMFDLPLFNRLQLEDIGVPKEAFKLQYNFCTACDQRYCSYRRSGRAACRQMTVITLK